MPLPHHPEVRGVFFDSDKRGAYWKAVVHLGCQVQYQRIPETDQYTSKEQAEALAAAIDWKLI